MQEENLTQLIRRDFKRYGVSNLTILKLLKYLFIFPTPGLKFLVIFRVMQFFRWKNKLLYALFYWFYRRVKIKYGIDISHRTKIGMGCYIGHFGCIVIHGDTIIGKNCNISQGVTIGVSNHGSNKGTPVIGDNVFIGPGAVLVGSITIGNNVTIGANTVVSQSVPDNYCVLSPRSNLIEKNLSMFYVHNPV